MIDFEKPHGVVPEPTGMNPGSFRGIPIIPVLRPHGSRDWLWMYTVGGVGTCRFPEGEHRVLPHEIILYRSGVLQNYRTVPEVGKWNIDWAHFIPRPEWIPWLNWPELSPGLSILRVEYPALRQKIMRRFQDVLRFSRGSSPRRLDLAQNAFEEILLWCDSINPRIGMRSDPRVLRAIDHLTDHAMEPYSEKNLAESVGLSPSRLRYLFRAQTGRAPRDFHEEQRLHRARDLLVLSHQTVGEIAFQLGFSSPFYFTLRFKKAMGESPSAYRRRVTGKISPK
jgi:AraC family transcriptional regulator of arabinose operon